MSQLEKSTGDLVSREEDCLLGFNGRIDWSRAANPGAGLCLLTPQTCGHRRWGGSSDFNLLLWNNEKLPYWLTLIHNCIGSHTNCFMPHLVTIFSDYNFKFVICLQDHNPSNTTHSNFHWMPSTNALETECWISTIPLKATFSSRDGVVVAALAGDVGHGEAGVGLVILPGVVPGPVPAPTPLPTQPAARLPAPDILRLLLSDMSVQLRFQIRAVQINAGIRIPCILEH